MEGLPRGLDAALEACQSVPGWLTSGEASFLYRAASRCRRGAIVEIGSWQGRSTVVLGSGSCDGEGQPVFAVDPHVGGTLRDFRRHVAQAGLESLVEAIVQPSAEAATGFDRPVGLLFIDGDHSYEAVRTDFLLWSEKLVEGGTVAFHDTRKPGPNRVVKELLVGSPSYRRLRFVDSIISAEKTGHTSLGERLGSRLFLVRRRLALEIAKRRRVA